MNSNMKKDFQKVVKMFRDDQPEETRIDYCTKQEYTVKAEYPKAMMTAQQERKGTATVNCDYGENGKKRAEEFVKFPPFITWCESYGIKKVITEQVIVWGRYTQHQVRVYY